VDLERLLLQEGVAAPPDQIRSVLAAAERAGKDPVVALADAGVVVEDVLAEVLARASGTVVVDVDRPAVLDERVVAAMSATIARTHLALPLARPIAGRLRVAFANPLSQAARSEVEAATGLTVQALVATVSGVRAALARVYPERTPNAPGSEIPTENTRRLLAPLSELPSTDTAPIHRLERRATIEQRHEALLLALIEKGVLTRSDYTEALERLLSEHRDPVE